MRYIQVILPLAIGEEYYYSLPDHLCKGASSEELIGRRVVVPLGSKRSYTGIVSSCSIFLPSSVEPSRLRSVECVLDDVPLVSPSLLSLWRWCAEYYLCSVGSVLRLSMPQGLLPESRTMIALVDDWVAQKPLSTDEEQLLRLVEEMSTSMGEIALLRLEQIWGRDKTLLLRVLAELIALGALRTEEALHSRYKRRERVILSLSQQWEGAARQEELFASLKRAPRQADLLSRLMEHYGPSPSFVRKEWTHLHPEDSALLRALVKRRILRESREQESRLSASSIVPSLGQALSVPAIPLPTSAVSLLYGQDVGEKERYIAHLVWETMSRGEQVLLLTPSAEGVPVASSYLHMLERASGGKIYHYTTYTSEALRVELYQHLSCQSSPCLVVGTRSAIFLPMDRLGLIIIDEEQEYLYKEQFAPARYHTRDVALWRAHQQGARVVLTSETPSAEVLFNVLRGKYTLLAGHSLSPESILPEGHFEIIDLSLQRQERRMRLGDVLSPMLVERIEEYIARGERVLLLQNKRGYAPYMLCRSCSERVRCPHCDVSLHYHQSLGVLRCHYCGYEQTVPSVCPSCGARSVSYREVEYPALQALGYGVERVERELASKCPGARVLRIDSDSLQTSKRTAEIRAQIEGGEVDIIVGTQLIKGQPLWDNIGLIGIVQLESVLGFPDFRAEERTYQLLLQMLLRSCESRAEMGTVGSKVRLCVQTSRPDHPFLLELGRCDYRSFIKHQLRLREFLLFPPFTRLMYIILRAREEDLVAQVAFAYQALLLQLLGSEQVSPVQTPSVGWVDRLHLRHIVLRRPFSTPYIEERRAIAQAEQQLYLKCPEAKRVKISYDVDPL